MGKKRALAPREQSEWPSNLPSATDEVHRKMAQYFREREKEAALQAEAIQRSLATVVETVSRHMLHLRDGKSRPTDALRAIEGLKEAIAGPGTRQRNKSASGSQS